MRKHGQGLKSALGVVLLLVLSCVALIYLLYSVGAVGIFNNFRHYRIVVNDAKGLANGSDVRMAGVRIGIVEQVAPVGTHAELKLKIDNDIPVYTKTSFKIISRSLLGEKILVLIQPEQGEILGENGIITEEIKTYEIGDVIDSFGGILQMVKQPGFERLAEVFKRLNESDQGRVERFIDGSISLIEVISKLDPAGMNESFRSLEKNIGQLNNRVSAFLARIETPLVNVATKSGEILNHFKEDDRKAMGDLIKKANHLIDALSGDDDPVLLLALKEARTLLTRIEERTERYDRLVDSLISLVSRLDNTLEKNDIQRLKQEFIDLFRKEGIKVHMF